MFCRHAGAHTGLGEVWFRVEAAQCSKPYATVDRHGHRLRACAPCSPDRRGRRPRDARRRCVGGKSIRHLPQRWLFRSARPAGQPAACSIAVHILHLGKNAVCDPADWPRRCDQPCDGDFERRAAKRRTHHRVSFAHGPVSTWPPAEHFHLRLIRSRPIGRSRARTRRPRDSSHSTFPRRARQMPRFESVSCRSADVSIHCPR